MQSFDLFKQPLLLIRADSCLLWWTYSIG